MKNLVISAHRFLRQTVHLFFSYLRGNWRLFLFGLIIGLSLINLLPSFYHRLFTKKYETIGIVGNFSPSGLPLELQQEISFGLTRLNAKNEATSGAAVSWSVSVDGKKVVFNLDKNLFWQDGTKFDTSQINYNLRGVTVSRLSLYTLEFNFQEPFAPLPVILSQPLFKNGLIGLGVNRVTSLKFNGRFLSEMTLQNQDSGVEKIYKFYATENLAASALKLGSVNKIIGLHHPFDFDRDNHYVLSKKYLPNQIATVFFNARQDIFQEKNLRLALSYAVPDSYPDGQEADSPLPFNSWALSDNVKKYNQNVKLAKTYAEKYATSASKPKFKIASSPELEKTADIIAKNWSDIGIPSTVVIADLPPSDFDVYLDFLNLPLDPDQYALWHSTQTGNITGYRSFKVDRLLEEGRRTFDPKKRLQIYADFQRALTEDEPAIFLYYPAVYDIKRI